MKPEVRYLEPHEFLHLIPDIARLRIEVFRDFPYIYDGSLDYEVKYLRRYIQASDAVFAGAFSRDQLVGVATALPLLQEEEFVRSTFRKTSFNLEDIFYFGESVLKPEFRGQGIGHQFFDLREKAAQKYRAKFTAFCAVNRPEDHPLKPTHYRPLDPFWQSRGYQKMNDLTGHFEWKDLGAACETKKEMIYWMRSWT